MGGVHLDQVDLQPGPGAGKLARRRNDEAAGRRLEGGDPHHADLTGLVALQGRVEALQLGEEVRGVIQQQPGRAGQAHVAPVPLDHGAPRLPRQGGQLLRNRRGGQVQGAAQRR